ncbi:MAG: HupE/UreJ family protein [Pseudomonadales bacterium]|nr:HupE/UreJ family protein [Pseudomonadales bacterium]
MIIRDPCARRTQGRHRAGYALLALVSLMFWNGQAHGHGLRLAFMEALESTPDQWHFVLKVPTFGEQVWPLELRFPESCTPTRAPARHQLESGDLADLHWMHCPRGPSGTPVTIEVTGLAEGLVDLLVRVEHKGAGTQDEPPTESIRLLTAADPRLELNQALASGAAGHAALSARFRLGVDHILGGLDHLAFVVGIMLLMATLRRVLVAITAFTVAHSITLAVATFGTLRLPEPPLDTAIALSIVYLAVEVVRRLRDDAPPATLGRVWSVAFLFGLLHGFAFAGALHDTGLPRDELPLTLALFNLGIEAGQIAFVFATAISWLALVRMTQPADRALANQHRRRLALGAAYVLGSAASFWTFERVAALVRMV